VRLRLKLAAMSLHPRKAPAPRPSIEEMFSAHVHFVWRTLAGHGVAAADVEDATQEVFLVAHRRMDDWDHQRASARTWLYSIAVRVAANHRRSRRNVEPGQPQDEPAFHTDPVASVDRQRLLARVGRVLAAMERDRREVFVLFELEDFSMKEVAEAVGCPLQTAYARLYAARRDLSGALGSERDGDA
jgi:RNA polymerase sigma-70 factor, ECF subfamily